MRIFSLLAAILVAAPLHALEPKTKLDIPYAGTQHPKQTLDVYAPAEGQGHPVVVWIHGGGWRYGDKKEVGHKPQAFADKGLVLVSINYRLVPEVTLQKMMGDVAKATRWAHDHAKEFGGDPDRMLIMGHSAGAQLAALTCTDEKYLKAEGLSFAVIKGCVPVDGDTYDVPLQVKTVEEKRQKSYRGSFGDESSQKELSPITHVARGKGIPPILVLHVAEHPETKAQSQRFVKALTDAGVWAKAFPAQGKNHVTLNDDLGAAGDLPTRELFDFVDGALNNRLKLE
jgi:acetyl esterase/lipase